MVVPEHPRLVFFYGSREVLRTGIGRALFGEKGAIRDVLIRCERLIRERLGWSLEKVCIAEQLPSDDQREPCLTALQIALTEGWRARGVKPDAIAARCGGEFAAEYARGTLVLEDAIEVACRFGLLVRDRGGTGRMLAIRLGLSLTERLQRSSPVEFSIAADSDDSTVIACAADAVGKLTALLAANRIEYRIIDSVMAPHSPAIDEWKADLVKPLSGKMPDLPLVPYYSAAASGQDVGTSYTMRLWRTVREPALIERLLDTLIADGFGIFLEIGSEPLLGARVQHRAFVAGKKLVTLPRARMAAFHAVAAVAGNKVVRLPMPPATPLHVVMDGTQEILRKLGVSFQPEKTAKNVRV